MPFEDSSGSLSRRDTTTIAQRFNAGTGQFCVGPVPKGRLNPPSTERVLFRPVVGRPFGTWVCLTAKPSVETLGYSRMSLRDNDRRPGQGDSGTALELRRGLGSGCGTLCQVLLFFKECLFAAWPRRERSGSSLAALGAALVCLGPGVMAQGAAGAPRLSPGFAALPLAFEPLDGQREFQARGPNYQVRIAPGRAELVLARTTAAPGARLMDRGRSVASASTTTRALRLEFAGANPQARSCAEGRMPGKMNYLVGRDPARWRTGIAMYGQVRVEELYPGVSLVYYGSQQRLEYDFSVAPGTDAGVIAMHFEGVDRLTLDEAGGLVLGIGAEVVRQPRPLLYQEVGGHRRPVSGGYVLKDARTVSFAAGDYDRSRPLVIDPTMIYSTYFGGNGNDIVWSVKVNPADQSVYFAGQTLSGQFPIALPGGGAQPVFGGGGINGDAFVARVDSTGTNLLFFTFLGGTGDDGALDLALDGAGNAYVTGFTDSTNFPVVPAGGVPGLPNPTHISGTMPPGAHVYFNDAFVAELTSDGSALVFSSYLGGSDRDLGIGIAVDAQSFVYVTGYTYSTNFPTTNALVVQPLYTSKVLTFTDLSGSNDVFVTKFAPAGAGVVYSTYLGGTNFDVGQGIAADSQGNAYVTGYTASTNFPVTTVLAPLLGQLNDVTNARLTTVRDFAGIVQPQYDAFVAKIAPLGSNLVYCAYLGGSNNDSGFRIRLDGAGGVYLCGSSYSADFPIVPLLTTNIVPHGTTNNYYYFSGDAFLTKLVERDNLPVIQYSLLFGGPLDETAWDLALDPVTTNIFITGSTTSTNFPSFPFSATNAPFLQQTNITRSNDVFVAAFAPTTLVGTNYFLTNALVDGRRQPIFVAVVVTNQVLTNLYAVMFGGLRDDFGLGIDVDRLGNAIVGGQTVSGEFPVVEPLQPVLVGQSAGFLAKIQFADALSAVTIDTVPPNLLVVVDGFTNRAPVLTNWVYGSGHTLAAPPVESGSPGTEFVWSSWSNGMLVSNQVSPVTPITNYIANYTTQASSIPSPFAAAAGAYAGLFFDTNNLEFASSGFFTATLAPNGTFSATVRPGGTAYSTSGKFSTNGGFFGVIVRGGLLTDLQLRLQLDLSGTNRMTGQVSDETSTADIVAYRPGFSTASPAPEKGRRFLLRIPGDENSLAAPGGDGFGTITVDSLGSVLFNGTLGDGTRVAQSGLLSNSSQWPFYALLYGGRGSILGWLSFTGPGLGSISGSLTWFKQALPVYRRLYPGGYTFQTEVIGSVYTFTNGTRALNFSQGQVIIESGGLLHNRSLTNQVLLSAENRVTDLTRTNRLTLSINPATGLFQGSFLTFRGNYFTISNYVTIPFFGALLPGLTNGTGYFLNTNQSGRVFFGP